MPTRFHVVGGFGLFLLAWLALVPFGVLGCVRSPTDPSEATGTPMRAYAAARVQHYAAALSIGKPEVKFWMPPDSSTAAWCPCGSDEVWFNAHWLTYATEAQVDHAAAHEVAHLFLRPPCPGSEDAAEACAKRLEQGLTCLR